MGTRMERWNNSAICGVGRGSWLFHFCSVKVEQMEQMDLESNLRLW
jgi:hypothetical protein